MKKAFVFGITFGGITIYDIFNPKVEEGGGVEASRFHL